MTTSPPTCAMRFQARNAQGHLYPGYDNCGFQMKHGTPMWVSRDRDVGRF